MTIEFNKDPLRRALKLHEWPAGDREAWERARAPGDVLEPGSSGLAAQWRGSSAKSCMKAYGQLLSFLDRHDLLDKSGHAATRLNQEVLGQYIQERKALNASSTVLSQVRLLNMGVKAMFPDQNWAWMRYIIQNLSHVAKPSRNKRAKIVPIQELWDFGFDLMAKAEGADGGTVFNRALLYRDGLMIAMLAARPFRESNFASIVIGQHLIKRGLTYWVCFAGFETKNHQPIELPLPEILNPDIERYRDHHRPVLFPKNRGWTSGSQETGATCAALWLSARGNPIPANTVYERVTTITRARFGHAVTPHLFRDCAATSIAIDDPEHVRTAGNLLGHSRFKTTEQYYILAQSFEASRRHQHEIEAWRIPKEFNRTTTETDARAEVFPEAKYTSERA
jgi:integrase/recombinase XerD